MHVRRRSLNLVLSAALLSSTAPALAPRASAQEAAFDVPVPEGAFRRKNGGK